MQNNSRGIKWSEWMPRGEVVSDISSIVGLDYDDDEERRYLSRRVERLAAGQSYDAGYGIEFERKDGQCPTDGRVKYLYRWRLSRGIAKLAMKRSGTGELAELAATCEKQEAMLETLAADIYRLSIRLDAAEKGETPPPEIIKDPADEIKIRALEERVHAMAEMLEKLLPFPRQRAALHSDLDRFTEQLTRAVTTLDEESDWSEISEVRIAE